MRARTAFLCAAAALAALGCNTLDSKDHPDHEPARPPPPPEPAHVERSDKVDLLFVVDDSNTMLQEQAALRTQFPRLIKALATGDTDGDGEPDRTPVSDLHLGVVSSDMGLVGISDIMLCEGLGDDGILQNAPSDELDDCAPSYPSFLTFSAQRDDIEATAHDFACIATLGTGGCGFEQPLESALKALWPSNDVFANPGGRNRISFLADPSGFGRLGHGDQENLGFLRNDDTGPSIVAVIVISDEDDCSARNTRLFTPNTFLDANDPDDAELLMQGLNMRCPLNPDDLYEPQRYVDGLRALRRNSEQLVVFAAIVGVPPETVDADALAATDFDDADSREQLYRTIDEHPRMQLAVDTHDTPDPADDVLVPSCETDQGKAYPPWRIVEVAEGFRDNGLVQSICADDFGPAVDAIVALIGRHLPE